MQGELHCNVVHHGDELLLLVSMLFLLAIPKSPLNLKEFLYTSNIYKYFACSFVWENIAINWVTYGKLGEWVQL